MADFCVVTEPCRDCKYTDCVAVCPVDCFYQDERMLYIDPKECICCDACIPECPVGAIFNNDNIPEPWLSFVELNAERTEKLKIAGANITQRQPPLMGPGCGQK
jgi:ferredoxin